MERTFIASTLTYVRLVRSSARAVVWPRKTPVKASRIGPGAAGGRPARHRGGTPSHDRAGSSTMTGIWRVVFRS